MPIRTLSRIFDCFDYGLGLRMNAGWSFAEFQRVTEFDLRNEWSDTMKELVQRGWGILGPEHFCLSSQGLRFADAAAELFLR
jgi:coproporphyrinogen III oxidase-like Fe-S oxidoreductase